jgi:competence protein ComEC
VALTSVVAILATAPFAVFHFNRLALYGLAANLVAVPLTAFWIMPAALLAFLLMPLGLHGPALTAMGWGVEAMLRTAETVAGWAGAVAVLATPPLAGLAAVTLGGLWLALWQRRWRLWGLLPVAAGVASLLLARPPDLLVAGDGRLMAVRAADGELWLSSARRARYTADVWLRRGGGTAAQRFPEAGAAPAAGLSCDPLGCIVRKWGHTVALVRDGRALAEDCRVADAVISLEPVARTRCPGPQVLVDRFDLWRAGAHALYLARDGPAGGIWAESVRARRGERPWVRRPEVR